MLKTTKPRLPLSVRFVKSKGYETLQIRITIDGNEGSAFSTLLDGSTISTAGAVWDQQVQRFTGNSDRKLNRAISDVLRQINDVYDAQAGRGMIPTPKSVKQEWQKGVSEAAIDKAMLRVQGQTLALSTEPPGQADPHRLGH